MTLKIHRSCKKTSRLVMVLAGLAAVAFSSVAHAQEKRQVDILMFQGGYGIDFFEKAAREFEQQHPDVKITVKGDPRAWEVLVPTLAAGDPPDLTWGGWALNLMPIIKAGQIRPWNKYLDQPAFGQTTGRWGDTFQQDLMKQGEFDGNIVVLPYNIDTYGWWYDRKLFEAKGWTPPKTYEEFLVLAEKIKAEGIAPLTMQGRYPQYFQNGIYYPWVISAGGLEPFMKAMRIEQDAWKHPAFLKAAQAVMDNKHKHNFQGGCIGMTHTESQMELLLHRAAMIPCGSFIQPEMEKLLPPGFELTFMRPPVFSDGAGDPTTIYLAADGKGFFLPMKGSNPDDCAEYYRYITSGDKVKEFIETKGTITAIQPSSEPKLPRHLEGPYQAFKEAKSTWTNLVADWDVELQTELESCMTDLFNEVLTPEQFVEKMNQKANAYRLKKFGAGKGK